MWAGRPLGQPATDWVEFRLSLFIAEKIQSCVCINRAHLLPGFQSMAPAIKEIAFEVDRG